MPDIINALFEFVAAFMQMRNCWFTYKAKKTEGISLLSTIFFASWGYWNVFYYPHLGQKLSFMAAILLTIVNTFWVWQMIYYRRRSRATICHKMDEFYHQQFKRKDLPCLTTTT